MSSAAVAVVLGDEEACSLEDPSGLGAGELAGPEDLLALFSWLRYVNDIIAFSYRLCPSCIIKCLQKIFREKLSVVFQSSASDRRVVWLDLDILILSNGITWTLKNANREWLQSASGQPASSCFLPFLGGLPVPFARLRGVLLGKLSRGAAVGLSNGQLYIVVMELFIDLIKLGYPFSAVRALSHALPPVPAVRLVRRSLRSWGTNFLPQLSTLPTQMGRGGNGKSTPEQQVGSYRWPWASDRDGRKETSEKSKRGRKRRARSSSSSSVQSEQQLKYAEKIMWKKNPQYRAFVRDQETKAKDEEFARQGQILAEAIAPSLQQAMSEAMSPMAKGVQPGEGSQSPGVVGGSAASPAALLPRPPSQGQEIGDGKLSIIQKKLLEAEMDHKVSLKDGTFAEFQGQVEAKWSQRAVVSKLDEMVKRFGGAGVKVPRAKEERCKLVFNAIKNMA